MATGSTEPRQLCTIFRSFGSFEEQEGIFDESERLEEGETAFVDLREFLPAKRTREEHHETQVGGPASSQSAVTQRGLDKTAGGSGTSKPQDASARSNPRGEAATDLAVRPQPEEHEREILEEGENALQRLLKSPRPNGPAEQILRLVERTHIGDVKRRQIMKKCRALLEDLGFQMSKSGTFEVRNFANLKSTKKRHKGWPKFRTKCSFSRTRRSKQFTKVSKSHSAPQTRHLSAKMSKMEIETTLKIQSTRT